MCDIYIFFFFGGGGGGEFKIAEKEKEKLSSSEKVNIEIVRIVDFLSTCHRVQRYKRENPVQTVPSRKKKMTS